MIKQQKILIIDDDVVDRKIACRALTKGGWEGETVTATNVDETRTALQSQSFDCILLDYRMPEINGMDLLTELRSLVSSHIPIIMLTGEGNEMVAVDAMKHGAYDYLPKSLLTPTNLFRIIMQAIEKSHLEQELTAARAEIERQALHDELTGLGNRSLFFRDLDLAIAKAMRSNASFCVLMMDLNKFKVANDTFGHEAGDAILAEIGQRLVATGRANDTFYRLGGDEFTALIDAVDGDTILPLAKRIGEAIAAPIRWYNESIVIGASIGCAVYQGKKKSRKDLLRIADDAMYQAKRTGQDFIVSQEPT